MTTTSRTTEPLPQPRDRVRHPGLGDGTVRAIVDGGRKLRVEFDRLPRIPYVLPVGQFDVEPARPGRSVARKPASTREAAHSTPRETSRKRPSVEAAPAPAPDRQIVEALRMGVVPSRGLDRYTVGRDGEVGRIKELVAAGRGILVVQGEYGTGKTHLVDLAASEALTAGFLASRVTFDPVEVPPGSPQRVYREIIARLAYPPAGLQGGLAPLMHKLLASRPHRTPGNPACHLYLSPLLFALAEADAEAWEVALEFVEGRGESCGEPVTTALRRCGWRGRPLLALPDWRTFGQVYSYILGGIAAWAADAGWRGLAVFFDEAEAVERMPSESRRFAQTFLRYVAAATLPERELPFGVADLYRGGQSVHRSVPHLFRAGQPLVAMFAFTPHPRIVDLIEQAVGSDRRVARLGHLPRSALPDLAARIVALYRDAHAGFELDPRGVERLVEHVRRAAGAGVLESTRSVARLAVEYLDLLRHRPEDARRSLGSVTAR